jgi:hypothetical protein
VIVYRWTSPTHHCVVFLLRFGRGTGGTRWLLRRAPNPHHAAFTAGVHKTPRATQHIHLPPIWRFSPRSIHAGCPPGASRHTACAPSAHRAPRATPNTHRLPGWRLTPHIMHSGCPPAAALRAACAPAAHRAHRSTQPAGFSPGVSHHTAHTPAARRAPHTHRVAGSL